MGGTTAAGHLSRPDFENLRMVLASICIRRPNALLTLPGIDYRECRPIFYPEERTQYNSLLEECHRATEKTTLQSQGGSGLLECLLRLRLFCNGGKASLRGDEDFLSPNDRTLSILQQTEDAHCVYCDCEVLAVNSDAAGQQQDGTSHVTCCRRLVCAECFDTTYRSKASRPFRCPLCSLTGADSLEKEKQSTSPMEENVRRPPSKIATLLQNIRDCNSNEKWWAYSLSFAVLFQHGIKGADSCNSSLVFSFWTKTLDIIAEHLEKEHVNFVRVDGLLSPAQRKDSLTSFRRDDKVQALLMTFGTGSTGCVL